MTESEYDKIDSGKVNLRTNPVAAIRAETERLTSLPEIKSNAEILDTLLDDVQPVSFQEKVYPEITELCKRLNGETDDGKKREITAKIKQCRATDRQKYVVIIEELLRLAAARKWGVCKNSAFAYLFNGSFWSELDKEVLQKFLGDCAERMGMPKYNARQYTVRENLFKQFLATGFQAMPANSNKILINLRNGTFEIDKKGKGVLHPVNRADFLKYQLPFEFNRDAECPEFQRYLDISLPDKSAQDVLAEFVGYIFAPSLKLEKALILYGSGANGKSVFFDIISALLGTQNVSSYSIDTLCDQNGYYRAMIANKLINYSSEIGKRFEVDKFKQLCSGEPIDARLPYGEPFQIRNYARLVFNANRLPKDTEQTTAFFRRFLIIPFTVTIPAEKQDIELSKKIIDTELSGVFNWILGGLDRIIRQKRFSKCEAAERELEQYRRESDSVEMFIEENDYHKAVNNGKPLKDLYSEYRNYCNDVGNRICSLKTFSQQLKDKGFEVVKGAGARIIYIEKRYSDEPL
jgi:putative DNA primase/helicase